MSIWPTPKFQLIKKNRKYNSDGSNIILVQWINYLATQIKIDSVYKELNYKIVLNIINICWLSMSFFSGFPFGGFGGHGGGD